jgi:hypothetical protein
VKWHNNLVEAVRRQIGNAWHPLVLPKGINKVNHAAKELPWVVDTQAANLIDV